MTERTYKTTTRLYLPGLVGPSMLSTIAFRNLMQTGYGLNVIIAGGGSVQFLAGPVAAKAWALIVVAASICALVGVWVTHRTQNTTIELWSSIAVLSTYGGQCAAVVACTILQLGPNGFLPFWWPAALAGQAWWRVRNIVGQQRAEAHARERQQ